MTIISNYFNYFNMKQYDTLEKVFEYTVKKNCPDAKLIVTKLPVPDLHGTNRSFKSNTVKIEDWLEKLNKSDDDCVLIDCDMMVLHDISCAFNMKKLFDIQAPLSDYLKEGIPDNHIINLFASHKINFTGKAVIKKNEKGNWIVSDIIKTHPVKYLIGEKAVYEYWDIGYMKRTSGPLPFNGGVVFVRNTKDGKDFIKLWHDINLKMFRDSKFHNPWRKKYAGMNQASFGYIWETGGYTAALKEFPCMVWDSCREDWPYIDDSTMIIHVKSELRRLALANVRETSCDQKYKKGLAIWWEYARQALGSELEVSERMQQIKADNVARKKIKLKRLQAGQAAKVARKPRFVQKPKPPVIRGKRKIVPRKKAK